jgi:superfamily II DNA or RNA helicase
MLPAHVITSPRLSITTQHLRSVEPHVYARGAEYLRTGRVQAYTVLPDMLEGVVAGTELYRVRVAVRGGELVSSCTCPVPQPTCKHAVALVLCFLSKTTGAAAAGSSPDGPAVGAQVTAAAAESPPAAASQPPDVFVTREELARFVEEHEVQHELVVTADSLLGAVAQTGVLHGLRPGMPGTSERTRADTELQWLRSPLSRLPLRDVGFVEGAERHARRELATALAQAAFGALHRAAAAVRDGIGEEDRRSAGPPDPALAPLWSRLVELRRKVRAHAAPRSRATRAAGTWSFDAEECVVSWKEPVRIVRVRDYSTVGIATRLLVPGGGDSRLECTCEAPEARCTHALALLDETLDRLADPTRAREAQVLAEELLRPAWARALRELDRLETRVTRARAIEVWWLVEDELGGWTLSARVKRVSRGGGTTKGARTLVARLLEDHRDALGERDLRIAEELAAWTASARAPAGGRPASTYPARAFLLLVGHPRVASVLAPDDPIEVRRVDLGFTALDVGDQIRLEPAISGERLSPKLLGALLLTFAPGEPLLILEPERGRCLLVHVGDDARTLWGVLERHGDAFPPESHGALLERLGRLEGRLPLAMPATLKGREVTAELTCVARIRLPSLSGRVAAEGAPASGAPASGEPASGEPASTTKMMTRERVAPASGVALELELFVRPIPNAPLFHPGTGPRDLLTMQGSERSYARRDLDGEPARVRALLTSLPLETAEEGPPWCFRLTDLETALALVAALAEPPPGLVAEWLDERPAVSRAPSAEALRVKIEKKRDWFGITGELKLDSGRLELAVLLDAARRQQRFVRVDSNRWLELSDHLRRHLLAVADQTFAARTHLELSPGAVPAIRALAEAGVRVEAAPAWEAATERLTKAIALRPRPPARLTGTLRDYQVAGHAWLARIAAWGTGACLADDMGLGKTIQAIALLLDRARLGPALVIAPTSATYNWIDELRRFAPSLRPILYADYRAAQEQEDDDDDASAPAPMKLRRRAVVVASYGLLVRDAEELARTRFATLVLDEAQALKNPATHRARAARGLSADFRLALSGTPLENHLGELWSLFTILCPGLLGSWEQFRERYATPIERAKDPDARAALARVLRPFLLRRTKAEVARELPPRVEVQVPIVLTPGEQAMYDDARLAAVAELTGSNAAGAAGEGQRFAILAALTRLRLIASHPRLHDPTSKLPSSKLVRLIELLEELRSEGHRALVFSQFTSHLALVREELERAGFTLLYLDGATPAAERAARIRAFQDGTADAFLISLKAGGTGINLTAADYVIHLDPWWNPAVEDQATDRAHRIGQTRPVTVYRLIARGTIEEQILALHADKRALIAGVLEGTGAAARLSARDLLALLRTPTDTPPPPSEPSPAGSADHANPGLSSRARRR